MTVKNNTKQSPALTKEEKRKLYKKLYRQNNKEKIKEYFKNYYKDNKEKLKIKNEINKEKIKESRKKYNQINKQNKRNYIKKYYQNNKDKIKEIVKEYHKSESYKNKSKIWTQRRKNKVKIWKKNNKEKIKNYIKKSITKRKIKDPFYKFLSNVRLQTHRVVKQLSLGKKPTNSFKWIGCSPEKLKSHFESLFIEGMSWSNYGKWHIDHIRPVSSFKPEEWEQINHYTNLQPLWAKDNILKSNNF